MSESNDKQGEQESNEESGSRANTIWGSAFVRLSLYILLGFILLGVSRYVYLKVTDQYPANFEEQSIIQYPHLEQLQSDRNGKADSAASENKTSTDGSKTKREINEEDSLSQDGGRRE